MYFKGIQNESLHCKIKYKHRFPNSVGFPSLDLLFFLYCLASLSLYIIAIEEACLFNGIRSTGCLNLEVWLTLWICLNWHSAVISELTPFKNDIGFLLLHTSVIKLLLKILPTCQSPTAAKITFKLGTRSCMLYVLPPPLRPHEYTSLPSLVK